MAYFFNALVLILSISFSSPAFAADEEILRQFDQVISEITEFLEEFREESLLISSEKLRQLEKAIDRFDVLRYKYDNDFLTAHPYYARKTQWLLELLMRYGARDLLPPYSADEEQSPLDDLFSPQNFDFDGDMKDGKYQGEEKDLSRRAVLTHAVEALTKRRASSCCVPRDHIRRLLQAIKSGENIFDRISALSLDSCDIENWENFHDTCVQPEKKPQELSVAYLAGPNFINDLEFLLELGILPQNIWAFECDGKSFKDSLKKARDEGRNIPSIKLHNCDISDFFAQHPKQFDIVYLDFCGPIFKGMEPGQIKNLRAVTTLFFHRRLAPLGVLITNFAKPDPKYTAQCSQLMGTYLYPKSFVSGASSGEECSYGDGPICNGESLPDFIHKIQNSTSLPFYYSEFITRHLIDLAAVIVPWLRMVEQGNQNRTFWSDLFNKTPQEICDLALTDEFPCNEFPLFEMLYSDDDKGFLDHFLHLLIPEGMNSQGEAEKQIEQSIKKEIETLEELGVVIQPIVQITQERILNNGTTEQIGKIIEEVERILEKQTLGQKTVEQIEEAIGKIKTAIRMGTKKNEQALKKLGDAVQQIQKVTTKPNLEILKKQAAEKQAIEQIKQALTCAYAVQRKEFWSEKLNDGLKQRSRMRNLHQFCDVAIPSDLAFNTLVGQHSHPMHYSSGASARFSYQGHREASMNLDVSVFDECRYIYELLPVLHLAHQCFDHPSHELTFRFALDGLGRKQRWLLPECNPGCHVVGMDEPGFKDPWLQPRQNLSALSVQQVARDGNCLFHAVFYGEDGAKKRRQFIVDVYQRRADFLRILREDILSRFRDIHHQKLWRQLLAHARGAHPSLFYHLNVIREGFEQGESALPEDPQIIFNLWQFLMELPLDDLDLGPIAWGTDHTLTMLTQLYNLTVHVHIAGNHLFPVQEIGAGAQHFHITNEGNHYNHLENPPAENRTWFNMIPSLMLLLFHSFLNWVK